MEPDGWVVPGLDANFYSVVGQQLVPGTLLGQPATVQFTPIGWHWNYGDGSAVVRGTKGATWAAQGLHEFDRTATSHVYQAEGEYVIRLTIDFRAAYRFGSGGFVPIAGTITCPPTICASPSPVPRPCSSIVIASPTRPAPDARRVFGRTAVGSQRQ